MPNNYILMLNSIVSYLSPKKKKIYFILVPIYLPKYIFIIHRKTYLGTTNSS